MSDFRKVFMPYCMAPRGDGAYEVLNREYQPLGFFRGSSLGAPSPAVIRRVPRKTVEKLAVDPDREDGKIFLYDDGCIPTASPENMVKYLDKLAVLAGLEVKRAGSGAPGA